MIHAEAGFPAIFFKQRPRWFDQVPTSFSVYLEGYEKTAMKVSVQTLRGAANPSPRSLNPDSLSFGNRLTGSGLFGRLRADSFRTDIR